MRLGSGPRLPPPQLKLAFAALCDFLDFTHPTRVQLQATNALLIHQPPSTSPGDRTISMDKSPFNKLSAELRNHIAELALTHGTCHMRPLAWNVVRHFMVWTYKDGAKVFPAGLIQTCKKLKTEYTLLFYAANLFDWQVPYLELQSVPFASRNLASILRAVGPHPVISMRRVDISLTFDRSRQVQFALSSILRGFHEHPASADILSRCKAVRISVQRDSHDATGSTIGLGVVLDGHNLKSSVQSEMSRLQKRHNRLPITDHKVRVCMDFSAALSGWLYCIEKRQVLAGVGDTIRRLQQTHVGGRE